MSGYGMKEAHNLAFKTMAVDFAQDSQGQNPEATVQHAMASAGQSVAQAIAATNAYIQENIRDNLPGSLHAVQDLVTPQHAGQPWTGFGWNWKTARHVLGDVFPSWNTIKQAYRKTREILEQSKNCPE